jgi:hypothetical protein
LAFVRNPFVRSQPGPTYQTAAPGRLTELAAAPRLLGGASVSSHDKDR